MIDREARPGVSDLGDLTLVYTGAETERTVTISSPEARLLLHALTRLRRSNATAVLGRSQTAEENEIRDQAIVTVARKLGAGGGATSPSPPLPRPPDRQR